MDIILSTHNPSKAVQIKAIFDDFPIPVLTLDDIGISEEAVEDGIDLQENALKKAVFAHSPGTWAMADDTGIFITALDGLPGVRSARWAGDDATTDEITAYTLKQLEGKADRSAIFRTVVAVIDPEGNQYFFEGAVEGSLLEAPRVPPQPKMPYSPIFKPDCSDKVWAEMSTKEENEISHRGIAFRKVAAFLQEKLGAVSA